jgi:hypothetical protein
MEIRTVESIVSGLDLSGFKTSLAELRSYKSTGSDQILAELIQVGGKILHSEIHKIINFIWNKEELLEE